MAEHLETALRDANVSYSHETYPAAHGWMKPEFPVYNETAAERGWQEMLSFFYRELRSGTAPSTAEMEPTTTKT